MRAKHNLRLVAVLGHNQQVLPTEMPRPLLAMIQDLFLAFVQFSQVQPSSFLDQPFFDQLVRHAYELPMPIITLNDVQVTRDFGPSWSSCGSKGVMYPRDYDDIS